MAYERIEYGPDQASKALIHCYLLAGIVFSETNWLLIVVCCARCLFLFVVVTGFCVVSERAK